VLRFVRIELSGENDMPESTNERNADRPKLTKLDEVESDPSKLDQSKSDQSNPDQSSQQRSSQEKSNPDQSSPEKLTPEKSSPEKPTPEKPSSDQSDQDHEKLDKLAKIDKLIAVNRELAIYLEEQLDVVLALRQSVAAIQKTLEGSPAMKKKYEKCLQSVKDDGEGLPDIPWTNRIRGVLARLQRTGTL
jgi:hypothetical protein